MFGTCCAFYRSKATVIAASDVTTVYGVAPSLPIRSQYSRNLQQPNLLQDRFELIAVVKRATSLLQSFYDNFFETSCRFLMPSVLPLVSGICKVVTSLY